MTKADNLKKFKESIKEEYNGNLKLEVTYDAGEYKKLKGSFIIAFNLNGMTEKLKLSIAKFEGDKIHRKGVQGGWITNHVAEIPPSVPKAPKDFEIASISYSKYATKEDFKSDLNKELKKILKSKEREMIRELTLTDKAGKVKKIGDLFHYKLTIRETKTNI